MEKLIVFLLCCIILIQSEQIQSKQIQNEQIQSKQIQSEQIQSEEIQSRDAEKMKSIHRALISYVLKKYYDQNINFRNKRFVHTPLNLFVTSKEQKLHRNKRFVNVLKDPKIYMKLKDVIPKFRATFIVYFTEFTQILNDFISFAQITNESDSNSDTFAMTRTSTTTAKTPRKMPNFKKKYEKRVTLNI